MNRKYKIFIISAAVFILAAAGTVGVAFALLQRKTDPADNAFTGGAVNIGVLENGVLYESGDLAGGNLNDRFDQITSGVAVPKTVAVQNIDRPDYPTADTYVRVRLVPSFVYDEGTDYAGQIAAVDLRGKVQFEYEDTLNWKYAGDGDEKYYYYTKPLRPGAVTGNLIRSVTYTGEVPEGTHFELKVLTEGVAANQKADGKSSLSAWDLTDFNSLQTLP